MTSRLTQLIAPGMTDRQLVEEEPKPIVSLRDVQLDSGHQSIRGRRSATRPYNTRAESDERREEIASRPAPSEAFRK